MNDGTIISLIAKHKRLVAVAVLSFGTIGILTTIIAVIWFVAFLINMVVAGVSAVVDGLQRLSAVVSGMPALNFLFLLASALAVIYVSLWLVNKTWNATRSLAWEVRDVER